MHISNLYSKISAKNLILAIDLTHDAILFVQTHLFSKIEHINDNLSVH